MPGDFSVAAICVILMKNDKMDCNIYRGILNTIYNMQDTRLRQVHEV